MRRKDKGSIHKLLVLVMLSWTVIAGNVFFQIKKAGYINQYLEDAMMQANLSAILVDPYQYGTTGELVFANRDYVKEVFWNTLEKSFDEPEVKTDLGVSYIGLCDFRLYEKRRDGISESVYDENTGWISVKHDSESKVYAPDGTEIVSSSIYVQIKASISFLFGIELEIIKEHCVDVVSEEIEYEQE